MICFVLQNCDGEYYSGPGVDKFYLPYNKASLVLEEAVVFATELCDGKMATPAGMPEQGNEWKAIAIHLSITREVRTNVETDRSV